jgi:menaquinone-dependent protoporphyrinogen oxidase
MRILIVVGSKHGSTREIADALGDELQRAGFDAAVADVRDAVPVVEYDAVVIGSALYMGRWLTEARAFVDRNREALAARPVWLFSSGPLGQQPASDPAQLEALLASTGARDHRVFVGKLERSGLGVGEKLAVKLVKAPEGDFRDWDAIRAWARAIAGALEREAAGLRELDASAPRAAAPATNPGA